MVGHRGGRRLGRASTRPIEALNQEIAMALQPKVALSQEFLVTLSKLPSSVHSKVLKWAIRFQSDPTSSGINYEKIQSARDPNLKSVRIDQDWRGIVFKPELG